MEQVPTIYLKAYLLYVKKKSPWIWNHEFEREQVGVLEKREEEIT